MRLQTLPNPAVGALARSTDPALMLLTGIDAGFDFDFNDYLHSAFLCAAPPHRATLSQRSIPDFFQFRNGNFLTSSVIIVYPVSGNRLRAHMQRAAINYDVDLERISFKGSLDSLHHYADAIYATHRKPRKQAQLFDALLRTIASDLVPRRPERCEPRARKRRPKDYQLLTKPRKEMCTTSHRNWPQNKS